MAARNINGLTAKQQVFCDLYRASEDDDIRGNAKRCYIFAFGATAKSAEANGPRLLKDKHVAIYLATKTEQAMDEADISEQRILQEVAYSAFLDPKDLYDEEGRLLSIHEMPEQARRAVAGMDVVTTPMGKGSEKVLQATTKMKFNSKTSNLELLMKHKKMLTQNIDLSGEVKTGGVLLVPADAGSTEAWLKQNYPNQK